MKNFSSKILTIAKYEFTNVVKRKSYLFSTFILPIIIVAISGIVFVVVKKEAKVKSDCIVYDQSGVVKETAKLINSVADKNLIDKFAFDYGIKTSHSRDCELKFVSTIQEAEKSSKKGYVIIPKNFKDNYEITVVAKSRLGVFEIPIPPRHYLIHHILAQKLDNKEIEMISKDPKINYEIKSDDEDFKTSIVSQFASGLFLFGLFSTFGLFISALEDEKESKNLEMILTIIKPFDLIVGKLLGLGSAGLFQTFVWSVCFIVPVLLIGLFSYISPIVFLYAMMIFILGFLFFGSFIIGISSLSDSQKDSQIFVSSIVMVAVSPFMALPVFVNGTSPLIAVLTYFPLTSPVTVLLRMSLDMIGTVEKVIAPISLVICTLFFINLSGKILRASIHLKGQRMGVFGYIKYVAKMYL